MYKVMIVDDETMIRGMLERSLKAAPLDIEVAACAGDGVEALELAKEIRPDIVVTDISMPFMNGLDLIRALQENGIQSKNVIISGYDEFDYARTAIALGVTDYLLKPFMPEELWEVLEKIVHELDNQSILNQNLKMLKEQADRRRGQDRERALRKLLEGGVPEPEEMELLDFPEEQPGRCLVACLLNLKGTVWDFYLQGQVDEFMKLMEYGYFADGISFHGVSLEKNRLALCFCGVSHSPEQFLTHVIAGIEKVSNSLTQYYDIVPYWGLGRVYTAISDLSRSYEEAVKTWREALNPDKRIRVCGEKRQERQAPDPELSSRIRNVKSCIRGAVLAGKLDEALELLQRLMKLYASMSDKGAEYAVVSVGELVYGIGDDMEQSGTHRMDREASRQLKEKMASGSLLEIRELMEDYLKACCGEMERGLRQNSAENTVRLAQNYVEEHLKDSALSAEAVADMVHFSVSYLRQIFKEVTGESFNEFLIRKRMEKAGEYLQNTSMKIQDIAENCGYENQRYFASSFKKFYGCTPTEFKELMSRGFH